MKKKQPHTTQNPRTQLFEIKATLLEVTYSPGFLSLCILYYLVHILLCSLASTTKTLAAAKARTISSVRQVSATSFSVQISNIRIHHPTAPAFSALHYKKVLLDFPIKNNSFVGEPRPELNEAWHHLLRSMESLLHITSANSDDEQTWLSE